MESCFVAFPTIFSKSSPIGSMYLLNNSQDYTPRNNKGWNLKKGEASIIYKPSIFGLKQREVFREVQIPRNWWWRTSSDEYYNSSRWNLWKKQLHGRERLIFPRNGTRLAGRRRLKLLLGGPNGGLEGWSIKLCRLCRSSQEDELPGLVPVVRMSPPFINHGYSSAI